MPRPAAARQQHNRGRGRVPMVTIFDCDGTLVESETLGNEVLAEHAAAHGVAIDPSEAVRLFRGAKMADCVAQLEARLGAALPESFVPQLRIRMAAAFEDRLRPVEGASELARAIEGPVCVASSGPQEKIRQSLRIAGLLELFEDRIFSSYDIGSWKPEPDIFLHAAESMGARPEACAVVEDSLLGITAGVAAGMKVFAYQPNGRDPAIPAEVASVARLSELGPLLALHHAAVHRPSRQESPWT